jgi:hypothetical protein
MLKNIIASLAIDKAADGGRDGFVVEVSDKVTCKENFNVPKRKGRVM